MTTTLTTIRNAQSALIAALEPSLLSSRKFRARSESDLAEWAEKNPSAALRVFTIDDESSYEPPLSSNNDSEQVIANLVVRVSYPRDQRYGLSNENSMRDMMREDMHQIDTAIGHRGAVGYVSGQNSSLAESKDIEEGDTVDFLIMTYEVIFRRAF